MSVTKNRAVATCLDCDKTINLGQSAAIGQKITCPHCGAYLEITNMNPPELDWDTGDFDDDDDDDWDDDDDDWDEDD
jgi:DNA-directed RNA polymerase subunit RPC12/RpoP